MSIFDKDFHLPIEHLYDECKDVCNIVVPGNLTHCRADKTFMVRDIVEELIHRGVFAERLPYSLNKLNKICRVAIQLDGYTRLIPRYRVWFYYNSSETYIPQIGDNYLRESYLCDFVVDINGIIDEHI